MSLFSVPTAAASFGLKFFVKRRHTSLHLSFYTLWCVQTYREGEEGEADDDLGPCLGHHGPELGHRVPARVLRQDVLLLPCSQCPGYFLVRMIHCTFTLAPLLTVTGILSRYE